jgi:glyoxylase-like metal-dependent hydrolase (beta-lactamase superfamily II)
MSASAVWQEVGDRVYRRRYRALDLNVGAVVGDGAVLVVDTRSWRAEAEELLDDLRALTSFPLTHVVNTHDHFDHCFGNEVFERAELWGHERCAELLRSHGDLQRRRVMEWTPDWAEQLAAVRIVPPDHTLTDRATLEVGGRRVELRHLGRGHTDNDLVVSVADAGVLFGGDLVEEGAPPAFGDAWPLEWPDTLDRMVALGARAVVPGHGDVLDPDGVRSQAAEQRAMADLCRLVLRGELSDEDALVRGPYGPETVRTALERTRATTGPIDATGAHP